MPSFRADAPFAALSDALSAAPSAAPSAVASAAPQIRVGYVAKHYPRFSETFIVNEILAHERAGLDIDIFSLRSVTDAHFQDKLAEVRAGVTYLPEGSCRGSDLWSAMTSLAQREPGLWPAIQGAAESGAAVADLYQALLLTSLVRRKNIGHLHAHFATSAAEVTRLVHAICGVPYSLTAHAKDIFHESVDDDDLARKFSAAKCVVTVSDFNREYLTAKFPQLADRVVRIYNGLDLEEFIYCPPVVRSPRIIAVGRLVEKKGFDDLIDACALLVRRGVDFECLIAGGGEAADPLARRIEDQNVGRHVRLIGPQCRAEVMRLVQSSAVMAAPCVVGQDGNRDGMPTVLLEAMALGTPCVSTDVTGIPELVRDRETGLLVSQRAPAELAAALERLLRDAELRTSLAARARKLIETDYDIHKNTALQRELCFAPTVAAARRVAPPLAEAFS